MTGALETHAVVIVDDVPEIREIVGFLLEESGWFEIVGEAATADETMRIVECRAPDLVLVDRDVAEADDLLPTLRKSFPRLPVVILTSAADDPPAHRDAFTSSASAVLAKGTSAGQLISRLLDVLGAVHGQVRDQRPEPATDPSQMGTADAHAWLTAIAAASGEAIVGLAIDATIISWNAGAQRMYGYEAADVIGRAFSVLLPPDRRDELDRVCSAMRDGVVLRYDTARVGKDGSRADVDFTLMPVVDTSGNVIGGATIARDLRARRQTELALGRAITQLDRRNRDLARSNEELDNFAAVASHDLAQPLQVAYGYLDMVRADFGVGLPEHGQAWLSNALSSLDRMRELVRDILRFARSGSGAFDLAEVDMGEAVDQALAAVAVAVDERGAQIDVRAPLPRVIGDRGQLALVVQNLVANAVKFVPDGRTPRVTISGAVEEGRAVIRVADNGRGIAPGDRARVFEMFHRAPGAESGGTGLGLAIVQKVVDRHGGQVWIDEAPGGGVTVAVALSPVET